jgi:hypothetical protein
MNLAGVFVRERGLFMSPQNKGHFYHDGRFACDTTDGLRRTLYIARAVFNVTISQAVRSQVFHKYGCHC